MSRVLLLQCSLIAAVLVAAGGSCLESPKRTRLPTLPSRLYAMKNGTATFRHPSYSTGRPFTILKPFPTAGSRTTSADRSPPSYVSLTAASRSRSIPSSRSDAPPCPAQPYACHAEQARSLDASSWMLPMLRGPLVVAILLKSSAPLRCDAFQRTVTGPFGDRRPPSDAF